MDGALVTVNWSLVGVVVFLAIVVERAVEIIFKAAPRLQKLSNDYVVWQIVVAFVFSVVISYGASLDMFVIINVPFKIPFVGVLLVAIFMAGGSLGVHTLFSLVESFKETQKAIAGKAKQDIELAKKY
ncbi:hypothetical protein BR63_11155 [Thermanaerosceptrum fracticalcis]|uniref:Uncharacterized protein n=1 Tax=Thermanaerosceptrum fracticalcis TaxID=1712410 RepID=A0A7G6E414_THEFR|nr:hypothetical protein [Thermanaerosceptrum fracticalcis]QNB46818.1 hypothetical protein BR63_11155 [Thermanaerosceptrum fracticalcis]